MPSGCSSSSAAARMSGWVAEQKGNNNKTFVIYLFNAAFSRIHLHAMK